MEDLLPGSLEQKDGGFSCYYSILPTHSSPKQKYAQYIKTKKSYFC